MCDFEFGQDICCFELEEEDRKKIQMKKKSKINFFLATPLSFSTKIVYNSCFSNQHFAQIIFPCMLCNGLSPQEVSKLQHQNSNYNCLLELQKLALGISG